MKNLENYGIQELSTVEAQRTNGGIWPFVRAGAAVAFWHWDNCPSCPVGLPKNRNCFP